MCHANPSERARFIRCIYNLLQSSSPAVKYEAAGTLVTLSSAPTAVKVHHQGFCSDQMNVLHVKAIFRTLGQRNFSIVFCLMFVTVLVPLAMLLFYSSLLCILCFVASRLLPSATLIWLSRRVTTMWSWLFSIAWLNWRNIPLMSVFSRYFKLLVFAAIF